MPTESIVRNGFASSYGRFYAIPGHVEAVDGAALRALFLPRLTSDAQKLLNTHGKYFVLGQLKHHGIEVDEHDLTGNGTAQFKKFLADGKCDQIPENIRKIREDMHEEWLEQLEPEDMASHPGYVLRRYFVDAAGKPDKAKSNIVVGITFPRFSEYRVESLIKAVSEVSGLNHAIGYGDAKEVYLGWDLAAVKQAAAGHAAKDEAKQALREKERAARHTEYVSTIKPRTKKSPVGSYIVDCPEIEQEWPDQSSEMTLDVRQAAEADVFEASFDLGILEGLMIISVSKNALDEYCKKHGGLPECEDFITDGEEAEDNTGDGEDESEDEPSSSNKPKRKARSRNTRPSKKTKLSTQQAQKFYLRTRSQETGEGEVLPEPMNGTLVFDTDFTRFVARPELPYIAGRARVTARKVPATPNQFYQTWEDLAGDDW